LCRFCASDGGTRSEVESARVELTGLLSSPSSQSARPRAKAEPMGPNGTAPRLAPDGRFAKLLQIRRRREPAEVEGAIGTVEQAETRYAQSGELSIAYQVFGEGDLDLVFVPGFISHADLSWHAPLFGGFFRRFGSFARVITFDKRGTGLSERTLGFGSAEDRMDDIRAVMDTAGCERAALVGISEGGPLVILFAATYPERASALVPWGTFGRMQRGPDYPLGIDPSIVEPFIDGQVGLWGTGKALRFFIADMPTDPETSAFVARYERSAATPNMVREILRRNCDIDVRSALPAVTAPTLVVHRRGDYVVPFECGEYLAREMMGARLLELPGVWHMNGSDGGEDDALDAIEEFLTGRRHEPAVLVDRVLKTVLFTDIVESTARAATEGDRRWRGLLDAHDTTIRHELGRFRGEEVQTTGDGFFAAFDGPGRAINCAQAIATRSRDLGLEIRAGVHTGECELRDNGLAGIAVHIGARVAALAGPGEVLVTSTVRDLVAGSGIEFKDRGRHALKGVPGEWHLLMAESSLSDATTRA
jgi:class 3 adenylate cyclase